MQKIRFPNDDNRKNDIKLASGILTKLLERLLLEAISKELCKVARVEFDVEEKDADLEGFAAEKTRRA